MGFIEHYQITNDKGKERFTKIEYHVNGVSTTNGTPNKNHGYSYLYARKLMQRDLGGQMGFDILTENPEVPYRILVKLSEELEKKLGETK